MATPPISPKPTRGSELQKNARIKQLNVMSKQELKNAKILEEYRKKVIETINEVATKDTITTFQLSRLDKALEEPTRQYRSDITNTLSASFDDQGTITTAEYIATVKKTNDLRLSIKIDALSRIFQEVASDQKRSIFTKIVDPDGLNLSSRIWRIGYRTKKEIMDRIALGSIRGDSIQKIAKDLNPYLKSKRGDGAIYNTNRLARNELKNYTNDLNKSDYEAFYKNAVSSVFQVYQSALKDTSREEHIAAHNKWIIYPFMKQKELDYLSSKDTITLAKAQALRAEINCLCYDIFKTVNL